MRLLIPIDGSDTALRALDYALALSTEHGLAIELELLNVQPPMSAAVARFIEHDVIEEYHQEQGAQALAGALARLADSGVNHVANVCIGRDASVIVDEAVKRDCHAIVMGTRGLGAVSGLLLGSVANKVVQASKLPITLVP